MATTAETQAVRTASMTRLATFGLLAAFVASVVNVLVRGAAIILFDVPAGFEPLAVGPVTTTTVIGVVGATAVYGGLSRVSNRPGRAFIGIGTVMLVLSFVPLLAPPAFLADAPASVIGTLGLMHVTTAGVAVGAMLRAGVDGDAERDP